MTRASARLTILPCMDSPEMSASRRHELDLSRSTAAALGQSAMEAASAGYYLDSKDAEVDWSGEVHAACLAKRSIAPNVQLPIVEKSALVQTHIQVSNETTLQASRRLVEYGLKPVALNFANGVRPGGGFLNGARAQEEVLCRSSALHATLIDDPMYEHHRKHQPVKCTEWAILSPDVPVFRTDAGIALDHHWLLSFVTCAAPNAHFVGQPQSGDLLRKRIFRILDIAHVHGYRALVLGAWGCGAFANDPHRTAVDFRHALKTKFRGRFSHIVFAVTDWSPERRFLGPFRDAFAYAD